MKKLVIGLLSILLFLFSFGACSKNSNEVEDSDEVVRYNLISIVRHDIRLRNT